jgi:hypothetical protein
MRSTQRQSVFQLLKTEGTTVAVRANASHGGARKFRGIGQLRQSQLKGGTISGEELAMNAGKATHSQVRYLYSSSAPRWDVTPYAEARTHFLSCRGHRKTGKEEKKLW